MPPAPAPESTHVQVSRLQAFLGGQQAPQPPPRPPTGSGAPQVNCSLQMFPKFEYFLYISDIFEINFSYLTIAILSDKFPQPVRQQNPNLNGPPYLSAPPPPIRRESDLKTKTQADQVSKMDPGHCHGHGSIL